MAFKNGEAHYDPWDFRIPTHPSSILVDAETLIDTDIKGTLVLEEAFIYPHIIYTINQYQPCTIVNGVRRKIFRKISTGNLPEIPIYIYVMDFDGLIQETSCRFSHKSHVLARWTHPGIDRGLPPQKWADLKMAQSPKNWGHTRWCPQTIAFSWCK